jgi:hypothetical protein
MSRKNLNKNKYKTPEERAREGLPPEGEKKKSFEWRAAKLLLRTAAAIVFMGYVMITSYGGYRWVWMSWARAQPVDAAVVMADKYLNKKNEPQKLTEWLSARAPKDYDETIKLLTVYTPKMSAETFFIFAGWMIAENREDDARFWWMLANFRLRFDVVRCGGAKVVDKVNEFMKIYAGRQYDKLFGDQPKKLDEAMRRVLDFDAKYPAHNDPYNMCRLAWQSLEGDTSHYKPLPEYQWAEIRARLRRSSELHLVQQAHPDLVKSQERLEKALDPDNAVTTNPAPEKTVPEKTAPDKAAPAPEDGKADKAAAPKTPAKK